jgi:hypothetical protein
MLRYTYNFCLVYIKIKFFLLLLCVTFLCMSMICINTRQVMYYNVILRRVHLTIVAEERTRFIKYYKCVFLALVIQYAMCMHGMTLSSVAYPALQYCSTLSYNRHDFRRKIVERKMCVLIFSKISSEAFLILRIIERDVIKNVYLSSCKLPVILVRFL